MTTDSGPELSVGEFVEYCRTQAGLLSGQVEQMGEEARALLDEIDEEMDEIRSRLDSTTADGPTAPSGATRPNEREIDLDSIEKLERDLSEKQLLVDAKQARMQAFQDLAAGYTDLAERLQREIDDGQVALRRVIEFEADHDAPAYFDERQTLCEAAAESAATDTVTDETDAETADR